MKNLIYIDNDSPVNNRDYENELSHVKQSLKHLKNVNGEWDNIRNKEDEELLEFTCRGFIGEIWSDRDENLKSEQGVRLFGYLDRVCSYVDDIENHKIFIKL